MLPFIRWLLAISAALALVLSVVHGAGASGQFNITAIYTNPDGSTCDHPCLFGMLPGHTKVADISGILSLHNLANKYMPTVAPFDGIAFKDTAGGWLTFALTADGQTVQDISLFQDVKSPSFNLTLGDVLGHYGIPDYMQNVCSCGTGNSTFLYYDKIGMGFAVFSAFSTRGLRPDDPISEIVLYTYGPCPRKGVPARYSLWMGLTKMRRYDRDITSRPQVSERVSALHGGWPIPCEAN